MLCDQRIDVSEGIDVNKTSASKGLSFNRMSTMGGWFINDWLSWNFWNDIYGISKSDAVNLLQNVDLTEGRRVLQK